jgi:3',5'-cyclic AMP phosphodiesterase CpdA
MTLLARLSDPHVQDDESAAALAAAVRSVLELDPLPDAVLVSGDLAEHAAPAEYERVRELLATLPMPVHVLAGNHDDRDALRGYFGGDGDAGEPYRYAVDVGSVRLVACDTQRPGRDDGALDLAWLADRLGESDATMLVAMHHAPLLTGNHAMDALGMAAEDRAGLGGLLARSPHVRRVIAGHVHRAMFGVVGGCGVLTCPSTHLQSRLPIGAAGLELVPEPPAIAVHIAVDGDVVSHIQPVA